MFLGLRFLKVLVVSSNDPLLVECIYKFPLLYNINLTGSSKTNFSSYMNIVTLIVTVVSLQVETACPSTVYMAISAFLKRSAENRKYTEEN